MSDTQPDISKEIIIKRVDKFYDSALSAYHNNKLQLCCQHIRSAVNFCVTHGINIPPKLYELASNVITRDDQIMKVVDVETKSEQGASTGSNET